MRQMQLELISPERRAKLEAEYAELKEVLDPNFEYSDDRSEWVYNNNIRKRMYDIMEILGNVEK
jgi:hypothetical protein